jgi:HAE1 family hydrophobic/amphiphilic exporter-1
MGFSHFFVDRPIFAAVVSIVITLVGGIAYWTLPVAQYPEVAPPTVVVSANYAGASAEVVAETVATPLEQEINGVENMLYMVSQSTGDGNVQVTVTFALGTDLDEAQVLVQNRVAIAEPSLPEEVRRRGITTRKSSPDLMMVIHLNSPDGSLDQLYISNYATLQIRDVLARLTGVGDIQVFGARDYSMRVWLNPARMAELGLTATDVVNAVQGQNIQVASGALNQLPMSNPGAFQLSIETLGRLEDVRQFENIVVKTDTSGRVTRVRDVARVELGAEDYLRNAYLDDKQATALGVFQLPGSNALATAETVQATMEELKKSFPRGLDYSIIYNPTEFIQQSVDEVVKTIFEAVALVVVVVVLFLQTWRAAVIPIVAIPVSLIGTFAVMSALGFSLNNLSLFGLVLAIGIVVDDAIVVVENVERNLRQGVGPKEAAHKTMDEVGGALLAIALVLSAVFVPAAMIAGIQGQFYRQFAVTIAVSTLISCLVSLTLSPALCALLLKPHEAEGHGKKGSPLTAPVRAFFNGFNRLFDRLSAGYAGLTRRLVRLSLLVLLVYTGLIGLTGWQFQRTPTGFIPEQDQGYLITAIQLPPGSSLERTDAVVREATRRALSVPGTAHTAGFAGAGRRHPDQRPERRCHLRHPGAVRGARRAGHPRRGHRRRPAPRTRWDAGGAGAGHQPAAGARRRHRRRLQALRRGPPRPRPRGAAGGDPSARRAGEPGAGPGRGVLALQHPHAQGLRRHRPREGRDAGRAGPERVRHAQRLSRLVLRERLQLPGPHLPRAGPGGRRVPARGARHRQPEDAQRRRRHGADRLDRDLPGRDRPLPRAAQQPLPAAEVQGSTLPGFSTGQAIAAMERLAAETLPDGFGYAWTELAYQEKQAGNTAIYVFIASVIFVFLLLAAQYESWLLPLAVVLIVPMCLLAAVTGVQLRGIDNNILVQVGLIVLVGLAAKNAILIVEFAKQREDEGEDPAGAAVDAARSRLRPILMTSFAFILGVVPLVIAEGAGAEMRQALGTAVFSGMLGVTLFGLLFTPVFYVVCRRLGSLGRRGRAGRGGRPRAGAGQDGSRGDTPGRVGKATTSGLSSPAWRSGRTPARRRAGRRRWPAGPRPRSATRATRGRGRP